MIPDQVRPWAITVWAALHGFSLLAVDGVLEKQSADVGEVIDRACRSIVGMVFQR